MSRDITASLEAEYEPAHTRTDKRTVVGSTCSTISDEPVCSSPGEDKEMRF